MNSKYLFSSLSKSKIMEYALVSLIITICCIYIYVYLVPSAAYLWDESTFLYSSYQTYIAITSGNARNVILSLQSQFTYPPFQSLIISLFTFFTGFNLISARIPNIIIYFFTLFTTYVLTKRIALCQKYLSAYLALLFCIGSPLFYYFAAVSTKEMLGALFTNIIILSFLNNSNIRPRNALITGLFVAGLFFTKYPYWIFTVVAMGIEIFVEKNIFSQKKAVIHTMITFLPSSVSFIIWVLVPNKLSTFLTSVSNSSFSYTGEMTSVLNYFLYYPRAVIYTYAINTFIGVLILISYISSVFFLKHKATRILWLFIGINFFFVGFHWSNVQERYIFTTSSLLFALSANVIISLGNKIILTLHGYRIHSNFFILASLIFITFVNIPDLPQKITGSSAKAMKAVTFDQSDYYDNWFDYNTGKWLQHIQTDKENTMKYILEYIRDQLDLSKYIRVIVFGNEWSMDYFNLILTLGKKDSLPKGKKYSSYVVTVIPSAQSRYRTLDYQKVNAWKEKEAINIASSSEYIFISKKLFSKQQVEVILYGVQ